MPKKTIRELWEETVAAESARRERINYNRRQCERRRTIPRNRERENEQQRARRRKDGVMPRKPRPPKGTIEYLNFMRDYMREYRRKHGRKANVRKDPDKHRKLAREHARAKRGAGYVTILEKEAAKRGMTIYQLRKLLLTIICDKGLIDAILDA